MLCKSQTPYVESQKEQNTCVGILKDYSLTSCSLGVGSLKGNDRERWFAEKLTRYTTYQVHRSKRSTRVLKEMADDTRDVLISKSLHCRDPRGRQSGPRIISLVCFLESLQTNLKVKDSSLISGR